HVVLIVFLFHLLSSISRSRAPLALHSFPTRRSSDLSTKNILPNIFQRPHTLTHRTQQTISLNRPITHTKPHTSHNIAYMHYMARSEEHTSELQSRFDLVCRLLLEKKNKEFHHHLHIY